MKLFALILIAALLLLDIARTAPPPLLISSPESSVSRQPAAAAGYRICGTPDAVKVKPPYAPVDKRKPDNRSVA